MCYVVCAMCHVPCGMCHVPCAKLHENPSLILPRFRSSTLSPSSTGNPPLKRSKTPPANTLPPPLPPATSPVSINRAERRRPAVPSVFNRWNPPPPPPPGVSSNLSHPARWSGRTSTRINTTTSSCVRWVPPRSRPITWLVARVARWPWPSRSRQVIDCFTALLLSWPTIIIPCLIPLSPLPPWRLCGIRWMGTARRRRRPAKAAGNSRRLSALVPLIRYCRNSLKAMSISSGMTRRRIVILWLPFGFPWGVLSSWAMFCKSLKRISAEIGFFRGGKKVNLKV